MTLMIGAYLKTLLGGYPFLISFVKIQEKYC